MDNIDALIESLVDGLENEYLKLMFAEISSGKKLRSKLILKIAGKSDESLLLCAIVEMIQAASLLHDDVIDSATTRRGKISINAKFGSKDAIMLGDILYAKAFFELCKFDNKISQSISSAVYKLSIGELMDVELSKNFSLCKDRYLDMIYHKTAVFIEEVARSASILASLDTNKFASYGKNLGIAFQLIDDLLDITQDSQTLGKPAFHDFKEGKTTLPYIYLHDLLDDDKKFKLQDMFKKELNGDQILWIKEQFDKFGIVQKCYDMAKNYANKALEDIKEYQNSELEDMVKTMIDRKF